MARRRDGPDRRGMGAQSDFIAEQFVPSEEYKAQQRARIHLLLTAGLDPERLGGMFLVQPDPVRPETPEDRKPGDR